MIELLRFFTSFIHKLQKKEVQLKKIKDSTRFVLSAGCSDMGFHLALVT